MELEKVIKVTSATHATIYFLRKEPSVANYIKVLISIRSGCENTNEIFL